MDLNAWKYLLEGALPDGVDCHTMRNDLGGGLAVELESAIFLHGLVRRIQPWTVLETGRHLGLSSAVIAMALKEASIAYPNHPAGHLYTCDPNDYNGRPEEIWKACGVSDYITNHVGNSYDWQTPARNIRFCFLDADHSASAIKREFNLFLPYFDQKRVFVAFHDTRLDRRMCMGIKDILDKSFLYDYKHVQHFAMRNFRGFDMIMLSNEDLYDGIPD